MTKLPLEEFSALFAPDAPDPIAKARDAGRAEGYDNGYTSGWDDAMQAVEDKGRQVSDELLRAVQDAKLTTTSAAARAEAEALSVLSALMEQAIEPVLPEALALRVQQEVASVLNSASNCWWKSR